MKNHWILLLLVIGTGNSVGQTFTKLKIDTLLLEKISVRAIAIENNSLFYAANQNRIGRINLNSKIKDDIFIKKDTLKIEFRSCFKTKHAFFALSVASPALLYKISNDLKSVKLVYEENHKDVFYDSMNFFDSTHGIAIGDPIDGLLSIITTKNGGETWQKQNSAETPKLQEGEAFFAASNGNISIKGNKIWLVSGGKKSRVFYSLDRGKHWKIFETPIIQGEAMTGIYSCDFYNSKIGFVAGGNYDKPNQNFQNKAITFDGGKTWKLVGDNQGFGYSSCIQFVPNSRGKSLVSVGADGIFCSSDFGQNWKQLHPDKDFYTIRFINSTTAVAAGKNKMVQITFQ